MASILAVAFSPIARRLEPLVGRFLKRGFGSADSDKRHRRNRLLLDGRAYLGRS